MSVLIGVGVPVGGFPAEGMIGGVPASTRSQILAAVLGLVLLAAMVGFAVGLPKSEGDEAPDLDSSDSSSADVSLPDSLPGGLIALDSGDLPPELQAQIADPTILAEQQKSAVDSLSELYDAPASFRVYSAEDGLSVAQVTGVGRAAGVMLADFPPIDPGLLGVARNNVELVDVGDAVCALTWSGQVPQGQPIDPAEVPQAVRCQQGDDARTFEIQAQGMSAETAADVVDSLVTSAAD
ncbi:hypothetical protein [Nocardioides sp. GXZ039]|uniref:hypothetical protein n=1 Tax=Nocardioides sp. GXZ039 TaxID=3136018 RepID=UPI0030F38D6C